MLQAARNYSSSVAIDACHRLGELAARCDAELAVDAAQVVLDRLGTEVELGGGLSCRQARGKFEGDLQLARCELVERAWIAFARRLTRGCELEARALGPRLGAELAEGREGRAQVRTGIAPAARAAQALAVGQ